MVNRRTEVNKYPEAPGKPSALEVTTDYVHICWKKPETVSDTDTYQVRYKEVPGGKWIFCNDQFELNQGKVNGLKSDTSYIFKVHTVYDDRESPYSEDSAVIRTHVAFAAKLVQCSTVVRNDRNALPTKHALPLIENKEGRYEEYKTKKYDIGEKSEVPTSEKTIMLLGATGTGKSTLVDGLANYVLGVNFEDPYRFTVMDVEDREKQGNQAVSQTEWITCYSFNPQEGSRINYRLNVIDTPGFCDTRGLDRDHHIVEQIRHLFEQTGERGVQYIDAVCFLVKAPDARLTATQRYIFNAIMSIFGKDIEQNICTFITFADGSDPPVLSAVRECDLQCGKHFIFNNSAVFAQTANAANLLSPMFWEMGMNSFNAFLDHLKTKETKSIQLTRDVLHERHRLEVTVENLQSHIDAGLSTIQRIKDEQKIFEENQSSIEANKAFRYTVTETKQEMIDLPPGQHTTTCLQCNWTCHNNCGIADDDEKQSCSAMKNGSCVQCPGNCHWRQHKNRPYILRYNEVKVQKTYTEMLAKYQEAEGKDLTLRQLLERMDRDLETLSGSIEGMVQDINDCNNRLKEIALRPNPLGMKDHIMLMIMSEKKEQKDGYINRISILEGFLAKASIRDTFNKFRDEKSNLQKTTHKVKPNTPGKPSAVEVTTDYVHICWAKSETVSDTVTYQVRYKEDPAGKWIFCNDQFEQNQCKVYGLKADMSYIFKVRTVYEEGESPYSKDSAVIRTHATSASTLVQSVTVLHVVGNEKALQTKYALPLTENIDGRNEEYKTKKYDIGKKSKVPTSEKTIMLLGATGTGKSTLVDGLANYVLGVNFEDPYRFTVMDVEDREKQGNRAVSQTDWITCYSFYPNVGTRIKYQLNIIDTPGFGDTRGLERDNHIVEQIRHLFEQTGERGVQYIDAVCFLVKAPDARLTATQRYVFNAIMAILGKDIEQNFCTLITFADGSDPPVLSALKECNLPFGCHFTFNNSALFAQTANAANLLSPMFWKMGMNSFICFFDYLRTKERKSIQLTKEVLQERYHLEVTIENLQSQIDVGLCKIQSIKDEIKIFQESQATIDANKEFHYTVTEMQQELIDLQPGKHTTTCLTCNRTCHNDCIIADDDEKQRCSAMKNGSCVQCPGNCDWRQHKNRPYIIKYNEVKVKKTYEAMLKKYQEADGNELTLRQVLEKMDEDLETLSNIIEEMVQEITDCNNRLKKIALRPNPLGTKDHIMLMIMSEKKEQKDGYINRIRILQGFLQKANIHDTFMKFRDEKSNLQKTTHEVKEKKPSLGKRFKPFFWFKD